MSEVREHNNSTLLSEDGKMNPEPRVGDMVRNFYNHNDVGTVVEVIDRVQSKVLWAKYHNPYVFISGIYTLQGTLNYVHLDSKV